MTRKKAYLVILAVLLAALTVLLSGAAVRIWQEGSARKAEKPLEAVYTPEAVEEQMRRISPLLFMVLGMAAAGLLLGIRDEGSTRPVSSPEAERDLIVSRLRETDEGIRKERKRQLFIRRTRWAAFALCMVPILVYFADRGHFPEKDLEGMAASLVLHTLPWAALGLMMLLGGAFLEEKSIRRETEAAKSLLKAGSVRPAASAGGRQTGRGITAARILLLAAAAVFMVLGVLNGSLKDVLLKAINICTECIGLG